VSFLSLVVDDESDIEDLFRQQFRRDLRAGRWRDPRPRSRHSLAQWRCLFGAHKQTFGARQPSRLTMSRLQPVSASLCRANFVNALKLRLVR
jgi:hypothetical protein